MTISTNKNKLIWNIIQKITLHEELTLQTIFQNDFKTIIVNIFLRFGLHRKESILGRVGGGWAEVMKIEKKKKGLPVSCSVLIITEQNWLIFHIKSIFP